MMIEISNVSFSNKGSQLMFCAIREALSERLPRPRFCLSPYAASFEDRAAYGVFQKMEIQRKGRGRLIRALLHSGYRKPYGIVEETEIDALLDTAGFLFGDGWGLRDIRLMAEAAERYKERGKPVILLPQAFGPFEREAVRKEMCRIARHADLIYVRDRVSLGHVKKAVGDLPNLRLSPDFTNLLKGRVPPYAFDRPRACLIPNANVVKQDPSALTPRYVGQLAHAYRLLADSGHEPFFLAHTASMDDPLMIELSSAVGGAEMLREPDPILLKGLLGRCSLVVGSRFHALVSALSQAVPCLAIGWSHKYDELFADYDCPDAAITLHATPEELGQRLRPLLSGPARDERIRRLRDAGERQQIQVRAMWVEIVDRLEQGNIHPSIPLRATTRRVTNRMPLSWLRALCGNPPLRFSYHVVSPHDLAHIRPLYPYKNPEQFDQDLQFLTSHLRFSHPSELPHPGHLMTIDDGYVECFTEIAPALKRHNVPAIFFVTTEWMGNRRLFHRNLVALCLRQLETIPDEQLYERGFGEIGRARLIVQLKSLPRAKEDEIRQIAERLGVDGDAFLHEQKPYLTLEQIGSLVRDGFVIGSHSRFHDNLGSANPESLRAEIIDSCRSVRDWTGQDRVAFSFPYESAPRHAQVLSDIEATHPWINGFFARSPTSNSKLIRRQTVDDPNVPIRDVLRFVYRSSWRTNHPRD